EPVWSRGGDRVVWGATPEGAEGTELVVVDPRRPDARKSVVTLNGRYLKAEDWSPDDRQLAYTDVLSDSNESRVWLVSVETGERKRVAPRSDKIRAVHEAPVFSRDGGALYFITDQGSECRRVARVDLKTLQTSFVTSGVGSD